MTAMNLLTAESTNTAELKGLKESERINEPETYPRQHPELHPEGYQNINSSQTSTDISEEDYNKECQRPYDAATSTDPQADQQTDNDNPELQTFIDEDFDNIDTWL
ncbi:MAG: hypothetical protein IIT71_03685 [Acetobacter sp.]|nr:hypothetical protein [Acetobacter sp.]